MRRWRGLVIVLLIGVCLTAFFYYRSVAPPTVMPGVGVVDQQKIRSAHPLYGRLQELALRRQGLQLWLQAARQLSSRDNIIAVVPHAAVAKAVDSHQNSVRAQRQQGQQQADQAAALQQEWTAYEQAVDRQYVFSLLSDQWKIRYVALDQAELASTLARFEQTQRVREQLLTEKKADIARRMPLAPALANPGAPEPAEQRLRGEPGTQERALAALTLVEAEHRRLQERIDEEMRRSVAAVAAGKGLHTVFADVRAAAKGVPDITADSIRHLQENTAR